MAHPGFSSIYTQVLSPGHSTGMLSRLALAERDAGAGHVRGVGLATGTGAKWGVILGGQVPKVSWDLGLFSRSV